VEKVNSVSHDKPRLVVVMVIDQMRADYLWRWQHLWQHGFKKLLEKGMVYDNVYHDHVPTFTAVGHATIFTGTSPAIHGIVANKWFDPIRKTKVYAVDDSIHKKVWGEPDDKGYSPANLRVPTVGDLLKLRNPQSKVVAISLKDRSAILSGGKKADFAFWYDFIQGQWTTSSYYAPDLPQWVKDYNQKAHAAYFVPEKWRLHPKLHHLRDKYDPSPYERSPFKEVPEFPYDIMDAISSIPGTIGSTPWGNAITLDFAKQAVKQMKLGKDSITDLLAISLSSTDIVGHYFGPRSLELLDVYVRLDSLIGNFIDFLDESIGPENYLLIITSDHGVAENWKFARDSLSIDAGLLTQDSFKIWQEELNAFIHKKILEEIIKPMPVLLQEVESKPSRSKRKRRKKYPKNVLAIMNQWVYLDRQKLGDFYDIALEAARQWLVNKPQVLNAWTRKEILLRQAPPYLIRSFDPERCGDIWFLLKPGWYEGYAETGTTHGTPYAYDQRVPVVFYGFNTQHAIYHEKKSIRFIAQHLVNLLGLSALWKVE